MRVRDLMTTDQGFIGAISGHTSDKARVRERFTKVRDVAREVLA